MKNISISLDEIHEKKQGNGNHILVTDSGEVLAFETKEDMDNYTNENNDHWNEFYYYYQDDSKIRNIDFYLAKAMDALGKIDIKGNKNIASERELSRALGKSENVVNNYYGGKTLPSEETMINLARIAKENPFRALIELNIWKSKNEIQQAYKMILEKIMASVVILATTALLSHPAQASPLANQEYYCNNICKIIYIMGKYVFFTHSSC